MNKLLKLSICIGVIGFVLCAQAKNSPNIILIMVDDFGYECVESYGGTSYSTPNLSKMAADGAQFNNAHAQNICTPSRVQIMTGQYNVRNYTRFATLDQSQFTFGHAFKNAGYKTCIVGKWQLGGDENIIQSMGFDEHCLWNIRGATKERYVSPTFLVNGISVDYRGQYGPDIQQEFAKKFIRKNKDKPFFLYYPMTLPHYPFQPTPDSPDWDPNRDPYFNNTRYFADMVEYLDKLVGDLISVVNTNGISEETLIIFTSDNGTDHRIISYQNGISVPGAKGKMIDDATHVPFLVYWPGMVSSGLNIAGLIDFTDIFSTLVEVANLDVTSDVLSKQDGTSFMPLLNDSKKEIRTHSFCWYMERTDMTDIKSFIQNIDYKLHSDGRFIKKKTDRFEKNPLNDSELTAYEKTLRNKFSKEIEYYNKLRPVRIPYNNSEPIIIPGKIECEQYDLGMPGVTYYDKTKGNKLNGFWRSDDVDILSDKNIHQITDIEKGEWLEYSIEVSSSGLYELDITYSSLKDSAISFSVNDKCISGTIHLPSTAGKRTQMHCLEKNLHLMDGSQILRLNIEKGGMHLDSIKIYQK